MKRSVAVMPVVLLGFFVSCKSGEWNLTEGTTGNLTSEGIVSSSGFASEVGTTGKAEELYYSVEYSNEILYHFAPGENGTYYLSGFEVK